MSNRAVKLLHKLLHKLPLSRVQRWSQDTQPSTQPSLDNEMVHETSDLSVADNNGMSTFPETMVSQRPLSQPSGHWQSASLDWSSPTLHPPDFRWGSHEGKAYCDAITAAYNEVTHWKRNVFQVPSGTTGRAFVSELAHLMHSYADGSSLESIAMKAGTIAQVLLLQKPSRKSKSKEHVTHLQRRLNLWHKGDIQSLLEEGRCIQKYLHTSPRPSDDQVVARTFSRMMMQGKVQNALTYLSRNTPGCVLSLDDLIPEVTDNGNQPHMRTTHDVLLDKHPQGSLLWKVPY